MTDKKTISIHKHRKKKKPPSLDDIARSVVKGCMEPMMDNSIDEPDALASGGFDLDDEDKKGKGKNNEK